MAAHRVRFRDELTFCHLNGHSASALAAATHAETNVSDVHSIRMCCVFAFLCGSINSDRYTPVQNICNRGRFLYTTYCMRNDNVLCTQLLCPCANFETHCMRRGFIGPMLLCFVHAPPPADVHYGGCSRSHLIIEYFGYITHFFPRST